MTRLLSLCLAAFVALMPAAKAEAIKVGVSKILAYANVAIATERGYFDAVGLSAEQVFFDSAQPIAVAVVSGDIDFGIAGATAGFYSLAGQGALRIIAGSNHEVVGFHSIAFLASNKAYAAGLTSLKDLPGHSIAITQIGTPLHYSIAAAAQKLGFDFASVRVLPLQSNSNVVSALEGGQVDAAAFPVTPALPLIDKGNAKLLAWLGDVAPNLPGSVLFTATKTADGKRDMVKRFLTAYDRAARDFHDAFTSADGKRQDGPLAPVILPIIAKFAGVTEAQAKLAIPYMDIDGKLDIQAIRGQVAWYKSQRLLKGDVDVDALIDKRYVIPATGS